jgi:alpha-amylase
MNNYKQLSGGSFGGADLADMSDHFIYGMWYAPGSGNGTAIPANSFTYQTLTDHTSQPSGRGDMSALNFRPNGSPTCLCGDPDGMMFFYDLDQSYPATRDTLHAYTKYFFENIGIGGMRVDAVKHFSPKFMGDLLDYLYDNGYAPDLVVGESYDYSTQVLSSWVNAVLAEMDTDTKQNIQPRIFDFSLRENIRRACDETTYDSRWLFESSIADAAGMSGANVVTFVNNHDFREAAQIIHNDPVLGYAYILTNNKLGLPTVFYPDFYGGNNERGKIKGLMKVHKNYIFGANTVHYLNKTGQGFSGNWISGRNDKSLLYQIRGGVGGRDIVVAINFDTAPLKVDHTIATVNFSVGDTLTDIFNVSPNPLAFVNSQNQIYMEVPPHSFGVWVQGDLRNQTIDLADSTFSVSSISIPNELPNITVYPNPFNKHLNIEWEATESGTATAVLFNMMGQAVTEQKLSVTEGIKQYTMFLSPTLPSGMYFLQLTLNGKMVTQKVIRE